MPKIPFKVSARTARLIGRENIASSKGAIIELVKNSSDADSKVCIVYFDNKYSTLPSSLTEDHFKDLINKGIPDILLKSNYTTSNRGFILNEKIADNEKIILQNAFKKLNSVYIIDAGDGMTQRVISEHWMTIGTDNKITDIFTSTGRVKSGAKGIGRFALDKLGDRCIMLTKPNPKKYGSSEETGQPINFAGYKWEVDWRNFEGHNVTIDKVDADLERIEVFDLAEQVRNIVKSDDIEEIVSEYKFVHGTILQISNLREEWEEYLVRQVFSDLEVLVPAEEGEDFNLYLYSALQRGEYGKITSSLCDEYDYKIIAKSDINGQVSITINRHEYDFEKVDPAFFSRKNLGKEPYTKEMLAKRSWSFEKSLSQLLPGYKEIDTDDTLSKIGKFEFVFYFMKRTFSTPDAERFFYKEFSPNARRIWLNKYAGIKVFRDGFRVRPYGEINNSAFDWLGLGSRKSKSPAAAAKEGGGYRVEPDNVSGSIKISRLQNSEFEDKSSREGLQENRTFAILQRVIIEIIKLFEEDRSFISHELNQYYDDKNSDVLDRKAAEKLAKRLLAKRKKRKQEQANKQNSNSEDDADGYTLFDDSDHTDNTTENPELLLLAELTEKQTEEIEKLKDEQKILRGMASSGIVIASFTHELSNLNDVLGFRITELEDLLEPHVPRESLRDEEDFMNPYTLMDDIKEQDLKMLSWLKFSLGAARKDKRHIKNISFFNYFRKLHDTWAAALRHRQISFTTNLTESNDAEMKVFELDLDSIFNNLIVNSIDAFLRHTEIVERRIAINFESFGDNITFNYSDNGPGISPDVENHEKIFEALFTTKRNLITGEEEGTGIGMWLVKSIIKDNGGTAKIFYPPIGFGLSISFPNALVK